MSFNSLMVRLKVEKARYHFAYVSEFQFLDGAIKSSAKHAAIARFKSFQFLDGAIKRSHSCPSWSLKVLFQFLDGAIKRRERI